MVFFCFGGRLSWGSWVSISKQATSVATAGGRRKLKQLGKYTESAIVYKKQPLHHQTGYIPKISFVQLQLEKLSWRQRLGKMSSLNECTFKRGRTPCSLCPSTRNPPDHKLFQEKDGAGKNINIANQIEKKACPNGRVKVHTEPCAFPTDALSGPARSSSSFIRNVRADAPNMRHHYKYLLEQCSVGEK